MVLEVTSVYSGSAGAEIGAGGASDTGHAKAPGLKPHPSSLTGEIGTAFHFNAVPCQHPTQLSVITCTFSEFAVRRWQMVAQILSVSATTTYRHYLQHHRQACKPHLLLVSKINYNTVNAPLLEGNRGFTKERRQMCFLMKRDRV